MTVANVLTATQGAVYMTDNGVTLANCSGPVATTQGSLSYFCDVTYTGVGSHLIVGVFLGDTVYGQSAGQLTEAVQTSTTTSTTTTTTTTTLPPTALVDIYGARSSYTVKSPAPLGFETRVTGSDPANPYPTGTVTIDIDGAIPPGCGTVTNNGGPQPVYTEPVCLVSPWDPAPTNNSSIGLLFLTPGTYLVTASYSGDSEYPPAQSPNTITVVVIQ
jgi:hypothetical protein